MESSKKIANALSRVRKVSKKNGGNIIKSGQIRRDDRELLIRTNWLQSIIRGWYLLGNPVISPGDSSNWYANLWDFLRIYLHYHFGNQYCLSAENSLDLHTGSSIIPRQIIVITTRGGGAPQELLYDTSLYVYSDPKNIPKEKVIVRGLQIMSLPYALCKTTPSYFKKNPKDAEIALQLVKSSELIEVILKYNFKNAAERLLGAYDFLDDKEKTADLLHDFTEFGWNVKKECPFTNAAPLLSNIRIESPYVARIFSMWNFFREKVIALFPSPTLHKIRKSDILRLEEIYERDAYHSLSIEGYQVDEDLIARVRNNQWNPDAHPHDLDERNALAARGYYEAFLEVKKTIVRLSEGTNPGEIIQKDLKKWYQKLFSPMVQVGIMRREDLIGYRRGQVYIRNSRHVPLPKEALIDSMEALFNCIKKEPHSAVRATLGHYLFVFIHPYMDGNGRIGRFLMNAMFISGGYPWTIIQVNHRKQYLQALEIAGTEQNIAPFISFIFQEMNRITS